MGLSSGDVNTYFHDTIGFMKKPQKGGRPKMDPDQKRTKRVDVFFTEAERAELGRTATQHGRTLSEHIRKAVVGQP